MNKNLYIIEDDPEYAKVLIAQLSGSTFLSIAGVAATLVEAYERINNSEDDLYLVDVSLPDGYTIELMSAIKAKYPQSKILALSTLGDEKYILSSLKAGADGYILKSELPTDLMQSITTLFNGGPHLSSHASKVLINQLLQPSPQNQRYSQSKPANNHSNLTKKEIEVLELAKYGRPAKRIASSLNISVFTVNQHLRSIYRKLGVRNKTAALAEARSYGIIE